MLLSEDLKQLYARALIAIVRAEGSIDSDEGDRLAERVELRSGLGLEDLLLARSLEPEELVDAIHSGPFRGESVRAEEVGRMLVEDALYVSLAKGHVTPEEGHRMWRYAMALGLSDEDFRTLTHRWLP
jgi:tellurite resistance protein TerB